MDSDITMAIKMGAKSFKGILDLDQGRKIDEEQILELCTFINHRLDCADFRMISILRTLFSYRDLLGTETLQKMENTVLGFKYWMDEPGNDSMCYWSENHQILFFTSGYLAGKLFEESLFTNSGNTGREMMDIFRPRILSWLKHRFEHGFIEWHSNTYYEEDIPPLTLLIDFADDELQKKATIILDLFIADLAMHNFKGLFSVTSGRCYEDQKREPLKQDTLEIIEYLFGTRYVKEFDYSRVSSNLYLCKNYHIPEVLKEIANDKSERIVKTSMGHDLKELKQFEKDKGPETTGYIQWAMESFTNREIIKNTIKMYRNYNMKHNDFLKDFEMLNKRGIEFLLPTISRILNPYINGVAIQKVNSYTYRNENFILSTAQNYYPGTFGDQQHIWQATINEKTTIFTTHPGGSAFDDNARNFSPSYWVGNGIMPHSVQDKNISLSIYKVDQRKGFLEQKRQFFTHAHFPQTEFDKVLIEDNYAFAVIGNVKVALIGKGQLTVNPDDPFDLIQKGKVTYWICELSDRAETFEDFIRNIRAEKVFFENLELRYKSLKVKYKGDFAVENKIVNTEYKRLESDYGNCSRCDDEIKISFGEKSLKLNFNNNIREEI